jgi:hypothetical protein
LTLSPKEQGESFYWENFRNPFLFFPKSLRLCMKNAAVLFSFSGRETKA